MDQNDLKTIQITIAGRIFPLKVNRVEEQIALNVEQELNDMISSYQQQYASRDKLDCVIMTMLKLVFDQKKSVQQDISDTDVILQKVDSINAMLETVRT
jgi:hypothetical protein